MIYFVFTLLTALVYGELHCTGDCQLGDPNAIMNKMMPIKLKEHAICAAEGKCPLKVKSSSTVNCVNGRAGEYDCDKVDMLSFLSLEDMGSRGDGNDIWGWTDPQTGKEWAIVGTVDGTAFVDVSDPANPQFAGRVESFRGISSLWRDIKVYKDHAYIVAEASNHGMQVFDLTRLRAAEFLEGNETLTLEPDEHYTEFGSCHNIVINEATGFAYGVGSRTCSGGLHMVDITEPKNPRFAGCFSADGYTHDAECVVYNGPDTEYRGKEICFAYNEDSLTIVDVSDKSNPTMLSRVVYQGYAYSHQGWLTEDHMYLLLDDELDEMRGRNDGYTQTYIWDVTSLGTPFVINSYFAADRAADHNLYIRGNLAYLSNYEAGLRILDVSDIANGNLEEVAFFDCHPFENRIQFFGAWSSYPYFESGVVILNSIERGLFVLKPQVEPEF